MTYLYPSWLYRLLDHAEATGADLTPLKFVMYGSSPVAPARLRQALERFGPGLMQTYATTEAPAIATLQPADHAAALAGRPELLASVGHPMPGVTVTLRRTDGTTASPGEIGEVCVQGPGVLTEYWNRPDDLGRTVLPDGRLRTGDLGRFDEDGYLYLVGRLKDMLIVDGYNHYAGPIEDVLTEHPAVREAAVVGVPDECTGEAVHAFVTIRPPGITPDALRSWAADRLTADAVPVTIKTWCTGRTRSASPGTSGSGRPARRRSRTIVRHFESLAEVRRDLGGCSGRILDGMTYLFAATPHEGVILDADPDPVAGKRGADRQGRPGIAQTEMQSGSSEGLAQVGQCADLSLAVHLTPFSNAESTLSTIRHRASRNGLRSGAAGAVLCGSVCSVCFRFRHNLSG
ncbi:AMP-binding protein [Actinoallomurus sp. NPDC052274]|uniref:class I adenylate-forming enzyme family protein n=1 Tax=Actinoallomurus sp. NPDC052274 TaxID=3155420 RepID=UPI00341748B5